MRCHLSLQFSSIQPMDFRTHADSVRSEHPNRQSFVRGRLTFNRGSHEFLSTLCQPLAICFAFAFLRRKASEHPHHHSHLSSLRPSPSCGTTIASLKLFESLSPTLQRLATPFRYSSAVAYPSPFACRLASCGLRFSIGFELLSLSASIASLGTFAISPDAFAFDLFGCVHSPSISLAAFR
jgi:hypothetical protein